MKRVHFLVCGVMLWGAAQAALAQAGPLDLPRLGGATEAPDCGGRAEQGVSGRCFRVPFARMDAVAETYVDYLIGQDWSQSGGASDLVVFQRRRAGGGCEGLDMNLIYDADGAPDAPAYLSFLWRGPVACPPFSDADVTGEGLQ